MAEALRFIPFGDSWQMRIDHPYSLFVRDGDLVWSCGQCPLAGDGAVLHPGDLAGQAEAVIGFIHRHLGEIGADAGALCQLVVYYVATGEHDAALLADRFRAAFGHGVLVTPVAIPHFYYDGMLIEVDVFASARPKQRHAAAEGDARLEAVSAGGLTWVSVTSQEPVPLSLFARTTLDPARLLSAHWFVTRDDGAVPDALATAGSIVLATAGPRVSGVLLFADGPVESHSARTASGVALTTRRHGRDVALSGCVPTAGENLVRETVAIMAAVADALAEASLTFEAVRKATVHYVAGSSADELHDNMAVRNRYYRKPGPASTGLPVEGFPRMRGRIAISLFARQPA
ncbi:MAG: hypothetical protein U1E46_14360 [Hyphomicrobiales bacterium]